MRARRWILLLGASSSLALAIGIPLIALTGTAPSEVISGRVVAVDSSQRVVTLQEIVLDASHPAVRIVVRLQPGREVTATRSHVKIDSVMPGERVLTRVTKDSAHHVLWMDVDV